MEAFIQTQVILEKVSFFIILDRILKDNGKCMSKLFNKT